MNDILKDLYDIIPYHLDENIIYSREYKEASEILREAESKLTSVLDEKGKALFNKCSDADNALLDIEHYGYFISGFKTGAQIMLAVLTDK